MGHHDTSRPNGILFDPLRPLPYRIEHILQARPNGPPSAGVVAINLRSSAPSADIFLETGAQCVRISTETTLQDLKNIAIVLIETVDRGASRTVRGIVRHFRIGRRGEDAGRVVALRRLALR
jgi:hypothetical protein